MRVEETDLLSTGLAGDLPDAEADNGHLLWLVSLRNFIIVRVAGEASGQTYVARGELD